MSDPTRYTESLPDISYGMDESKKGEYVLYKDYAKLKAENERLRKAGDAMDAYLKRQDGTTNGMLPCREAWLSAKEGTQSEPKSDVS